MKATDAKCLKELETENGRLKRIVVNLTFDGRAKMPSHTLVHEVHYRIRKDTVENRGHVTLRYLGKQRHLNIGWKHMGQTIFLYVLDDHVDVVTPEGELVGEITLNPEKKYQPIVRTRTL
jgi:hypothetical protein